MEVSFESIAALVVSNLSAAVIIALSWMNWVQYKRNSELQDKMLDMAQTMVKDQRDILTETNKTMSANTEVMRRTLEGR